MRLSQNQPSVFSVSCVRTIHVHSVCSGRTLPWDRLGCFFGVGQCPSISDRVCVNSRTLDIGKDCCLILRQPCRLLMGIGCWSNS